MIPLRLFASEPCDKLHGHEAAHPNCGAPHADARAVSETTQQPTVLTDHDIYLLREGTHARLYERLGCQLSAQGRGARFGVWAPNARSASVIGDWNGWDAQADSLAPRWDASGIWEGEVARAKRGDAYKYRIVSNVGGHAAEKADPFAVCAECPPATASRAWTLDYDWGDAEWMGARRARKTSENAATRAKARNATVAEPTWK